MRDLGRPKVIVVGDTSHQDDFFGGVLMLERCPSAFTIPFAVAATFAAWGLLPGTAFAESPPLLSYASGISKLVFQTSVQSTYTFGRSGGPITSCDSYPAMDQSSDFYRSTGFVLNFNNGSGDCQIVYIPRGNDKVRANTLFTVTATGPGG